MKKGQHPAYPCPRVDTPRGMTYRQHMVSQLAPVFATQFFATGGGSDYGDMVNALMIMVDSLIEAEKGAA